MYRWSQWTRICLGSMTFSLGWHQVAPQNEPDGREASLAFTPSTPENGRLWHSNPWCPSSLPVFPTLALAAWGGMGLCVLCGILATASRIGTDMPTPARDTQAVRALVSQLGFPLPSRRARSDCAIGLPGFNNTSSPIPCGLNMSIT